MPVSVMIVDDDLGVLETMGRLLRRQGMMVHEAPSPQQATRLLRLHTPDLALIDLRLTSTTGLDVARSLHTEGTRVPWILYSGFMSLEAATEAGRLGALRVVESPFDVESVVGWAIAEIRKHPVDGWWEPPLKPRLRNPCSSAERWACLVLWATDAPGDLKTLAAWADHVGASESTLVGLSDLLHIVPRDGRDFMRLLRALARTHGHVRHLEATLSIADPRTYRAMLLRAGLGGYPETGVLSLNDFLRAQRLIPGAHPVLAALTLLTAST